MSRYLVIIEQTSTGLSAYSPDLPGCVATGATRQEVEKEMHDAIEFHLEGLRLEGEPVPRHLPKFLWILLDAEVVSVTQPLPSRKYSLHVRNS